METVVIIGQGYVGLPLALAARGAGYKVIGLDMNHSLVKEVNLGKSHIDDVSDEEIQRALAGNYSATTDPAVISSADIVVVCVPTPLDVDGRPDLASVISAGEVIGKYVGPGALCILESTTYPGTTEEIFAPLVAAGTRHVGEDVFVAYSPERVDPGNKTFKIRNTPKVVGGMTDECSRRAIEFYGRFIHPIVPTRGCREAEMAKLIENTFRHVNIALVNEMLRFCNELDIDVWDALDAAATKPFGYMPFRPGPGVGGHCIPVDPSYLSHRIKAKLGYPFRMVETAEEINQAAPDYVASRIWQRLNKEKTAVNGASVLLLGVTYKADISDVRESPAAPIASRLHSWNANIMYHDPFISAWGIGIEDFSLESVVDPYAAARDADIVVLLQNHSEYDLERFARCGTPLLDTRGLLPRSENVERL